MSEVVYFADTYAFFEIIRGNVDYKRFEDVSLITTIFNLAELGYGLKKEMSKEKADKIIEEYSVILVDVTICDIKQATDLKIKYKKLSLTDAIGYVISKSNGAKFLTGDKEFEKFPSVEFIK